MSLSLRTDPDTRREDTLSRVAKPARSRDASGAERDGTGSSATRSGAAKARLGTSGNRLSAPGQSDEERVEAYRKRRHERLRLRDFMVEITSLKNLAVCGRKAIGQAVTVKLADGVAHVSGVATCGSVWACPVCSAKVRQARAAELEYLAVAWIQAGHGLAMATLTVRHWKAQRLAEQFEGVATGWSELQAGRWKEFRERYGLAGVTRALEVTHGEDHGWHTHIHVLLWLDKPLSEVELPIEVDEQIRAIVQVKRIEDELYAKWHRVCERKGLGMPTREHGVKVDPVRRGREGAADLARYLAKVQDKDSGVERSMGNEMTRGDLKVGRADRKKSRTPFEILADLNASGEIGPGADAEQAAEQLSLKAQKDRKLWHEYEQVTRGRRCLTWTRGLRDQLGALAALDEREDEEIAAEDAGGEALVRMSNRTWKEHIVRSRGRRAELIIATELGGKAGLLALLEGWGMRLGRDVFECLPAEDAVPPSSFALAPVEAEPVQVAPVMFIGEYVRQAKLRQAAKAV